MKTWSERQQELVGLLLNDKAGLRSEFWRVVCHGGSCRALSHLRGHEMIDAILQAEYAPQLATETSQR